MKVTALIAAAVLFVQGFAEADVKETISFVPPGRVVNGVPADVARYPYIAGLRGASSQAPFCSGSLIAPNVVASAAHCGGPARVSIGCQGVVTNNCNFINARRSVLHPSYRDINSGHDYMLIFLSRSSSATPILVAGPAWGSYSEEATIVGYGETSFGGSRPSTLQQSVLDVYAQNRCVSRVSSAGIGSSSARTMICAGRTGTGGCRGDSGGPLAFTGCDTPSRDVLLGVASFVFGRCSVASNTPTVFGRMTEEKTWFTETLESEGISVPAAPGPSAICGGPSPGPSPVPPPVTSPVPEPTPSPVPTCTGWFC